VVRATLGEPRNFKRDGAYIDVRQRMTVLWWTPVKEIRLYRLLDTDNNDSAVRRFAIVDLQPPLTRRLFAW